MTFINKSPLKRLVRKISKRVVWVASLFVKPITILRWTGILPLRMASFLDFEPVYFQDQAVLKGPKPLCIHGKELWNALPVSDFIISHIIEVKGGLATQGGYVFDEVGRLIKEGSHKYRKHYNWGLADRKSDQFSHIKKFRGKVAVLTASNQQIYWHWLFEVIPRLAMLRETGRKPDWVYLQSRHRFQRETLELLGAFSDETIIDCDQIPMVSASFLVVPCHQIMEGREYPKWLCQFLRENFLPHANSLGTATSHRIYVSRKNTHHRRVTNELEIIDLLKEYGFTPVKLEELSFIEQISLFRNAEVVVGPHGGGLGNLVFCSKGTQVIELFPAATADALFRLSKAVELEYYFLRSRIGNPTEWGLGDFSIDPEDLRKTLELAGVHP